MIEIGKERILIIAPHADDEILGCGGLIEKACRHNNSVRVLLGAVGDTYFWHTQEKITANTRIKEFKDAIAFLGCNDFDILFKDKDSLLDTVPKQEIVTKIDNEIKNFKPTMVFIPYPSFHQDHQALFQACIAGLRPKPNNSYKLIAMFEYPYIVWQYPKISDVGELYLDITETIDKKIEAFQKHQSQLREEGDLISPVNIKRWSEFRGFECGVNYAEKYYILRATLM